MKPRFFGVLPLTVMLAMLLAALLVISVPVAAKRPQEVSFASPEGYATNEGENELTNVTNADFGGNKRPDLAVTNTSTNTISVFLNQGDGSFGGEITTNVPCPDGSSPGTFPNADCAGATSPGGPRPMDIVAADFDRDRNADVAVTSPRPAASTSSSATATAPSSSRASTGLGRAPPITDRASAPSALPPTTSTATEGLTSS